nr:GDSL esterase/lipase APG [Ipomoea batatas]
MGYCRFGGVLAVICAAAFIVGGGAQPLVPAIITFGDSSVDVGNNNYVHTIFKADYPPYGRDFASHQPTGRFCNGKLATDITADTLGFSTYPVAYLSPQATGKNLLIGANFASAASGYDDKTAMLSHAIPLSQQLEYYKEYQGKLASVAGSKKAASIIKDAVYIVGFGSSDFLQNYYINPYLNKVYTPDQYGSYLVSIFNSFIKFNKKVNSAAAGLKKQYPDLKLVVFDIFQPLYDLIKSPSSSGFVEAARGCCGTGTVETTVLLCNPKSPGTCSNATQYVFWDSVHPSEAANQVLADALITQGIDLIG